MSVICISSSKNKVGKTTILSGIAHESIKRGIRTFVGSYENGKIITNETFYNIYDSDHKKVDIEKSQLTLVELNNLSNDETLNFLNKKDARIILVENSNKELETEIDFYGERLVGFIINGVWKYKKNNFSKNKELIDSKILAIVQESRSFMGNNAKKIIDYLEPTKIIGDKESDNFIENFLIGGFVLDWGPEYFSTKNNVALIARGDRPDVQLSAIQSGTVNLIIASSSKTPVEYVLNEAKKFDIPVVVVNDSTMETVNKLTEFIEKFDFDSMEKVKYANNILIDSLDFDSLFEIFSMPITK
ncbi:MAG: hypothetical protein CL773_02030 [Chloroflexi bacterium]|nr:hypothetical protein [Chloroflexota bacterium]|tara:strand:+ start:6311 stop:7216 length:906 start_codon:yes stop_codon:yes gene_type:complete